MKLNLAFIINDFSDTNFNSGGVKLFYELLKKSYEAGHNITLFCTTYNKQGHDKFFEGKISIHYLNANPKDFKKPDRLVRIFDDVKETLNGKSFDYIIADNINPLGEIAVIQGHSALKYSQIMNSFIMRLIFKLKKASILKFQKKCFANGYKKIIVPSNILKDELVNNFSIPENLVKAVYPGVDLPADEVSVDYTDLINSQREIVFGISASAFTYKGGYILLKALNILKRQGLKFKVRLINYKYSKKLNNISILWYLNKFRLWKDIEFIPHQKDMGAFYSSIDCLLMPSLIETFGLVTLEAMANKKTCIVSSVSGASEIIVDGCNGFVFEMSKKGADVNLAGKMAILIKDPSLLNELSANAFETAKKFSWSNFYTDFMDCL